MSTNIKPIKSDKKISAKQAALTSFIVDIFDVILNGTIALITGSVVMLAELMQSLADLISTAFVLLGLKRSKRPPDAKHPFGYGREVYVWLMFSSLIMFFVLASFSFYFGWQQIKNPEPIKSIWLAIVVLSIAVASNFYSFTISFRRIFSGKAKKLKTFLDSSMIETKTTFILDLVGFLAAFSGLISLGAYKITGNLRFDGIGAVVIGMVMFVFAFYLIWNSREYLIGKSVPSDVLENIRIAALETKEVQSVLDLRATALGSDQVLVNIEVHLADNLVTDEIEQVIDKIKDRICESIPSVVHVQVELETPQQKPQPKNLVDKLD